ncbi:diaminobutyrate--2-oxoglutarate transaminase [Magnetovibrio blakemorei]|uniref:Diaminobutyrate--2-oxoglutarate transaminase n=1 Tax=Magnetovibrio blakemorei TaxID=28181 RepID=A0A1E5Q8N3_9PROT|nr:diaminobutyrate--2-oxoglutarate transaminase [Magnetovibrio blakemorei]OEJ67753.1 diaminobutyrate--2-oxoglutarate transaminase [Magnetovibrio blakemorei]
MKTFDKLESNVRGYIRDFPVVFSTAKDAHMVDEDGNVYIDFFAGAGVMNYGHNNTKIKEAVVEYMMGDGITHSLDMGTEAKRTFLETFNDVILKPRGLEYKIQFPGPTGTNAVESALKLARKVTGRTEVVSFSNGFHGMTLGSLALTGNATKRAGAGVPLGNVTTMPFDGYLGVDADTLAYFEAFLNDAGSGQDKPAAVIVETVQGEGGVNVASWKWLRNLEKLCRRHDILMIVDDIQMGCGRTGTFFSFEIAGIHPDMVCLSKAIGGMGLPMALVLIRPDLDVWSPGEHNGTFRGNNLAFVAATKALDYWRDDKLEEGIVFKGLRVRERLDALAGQFPKAQLVARGRGMIQALESKLDGFAEEICAEAFANGLIMETAGVRSQVAKVMPPLTIDEVVLEQGLDILENAIAQVAARRFPNAYGKSVA